ncbi:MAG: amidohydrolase [Chloroflexi bacterium]|nr:amidohydrolase [Chloroflexota bacterium]
MPTRDEVKARVCAEVDRRAEEIRRISDHILRHPEPGYRETRTAQFVAEQLDRMGVPHRDGLALTGVKARLKGRSAGPTVAILGELDSLIVADHSLADPATGAAHACGHNAQIASMLGAGMALQTVMDHLDGDVVLFAVPAEEYIEVEWRLRLREQKKIEFLVGKAELIRLGEFDDVDMCMMIHTNANQSGDGLASVGDTYNGCVVKFMRFTGKAAHAGAVPHQGINALKAATFALQAIDAQRETLRDEDAIRIHPIITKGGDAVNVVPADVRLETFVRGKTLEAIADAAARVDRSLRAGALAMGASVEIVTVPGYLPTRMDPNLAALAHTNFAAVVGEQNVGQPRHVTWSTDAGDLSHLMPLIHPRVGGIKGTLHGNDYWTADHDLAAVAPARAMAMTVVDLLHDGAREAGRVIAEAGKERKKLTRDEYLALVRRFATTEHYRERGF